MFIKSNNKYFEREVIKEIRLGHSLYGRSLYSKAKCEINDDVIFRLDNTGYVLIHLTYAVNSLVEYPIYLEFSDVKDIISYIEMKYIEDFL